MNIGQFFPGMVVMVLLVAAVLTPPLSFFLLWLYRRAVLRGMNVAAGAPDGGAAAAHPGGLGLGMGKKPGLGLAKPQPAVAAPAPAAAPEPLSDISCQRPGSGRLWD